MKKGRESKKCNVELLLNLRTHDIVLIMPFLIPKIQSYISLSITKPRECGVEIRKKLVGMGNFNSKIRDVSLN